MSFQLINHDFLLYLIISLYRKQDDECYKRRFVLCHWRLSGEYRCCVVFAESYFVGC